MRGWDATAVGLRWKLWWELWSSTAACGGVCGSIPWWWATVACGSSMGPTASALAIVNKGNRISVFRLGLFCLTRTIPKEGNGTVVNKGLGMRHLPPRHMRYMHSVVDNNTVVVLTLLSDVGKYEPATRDIKTLIISRDVELAAWRCVHVHGAHSILTSALALQSRWPASDDRTFNFSNVGASDYLATLRECEYVEIRSKHCFQTLVTVCPRIPGCHGIDTSITWPRNQHLPHGTSFNAGDNLDGDLCARFHHDGLTWPQDKNHAISLLFFYFVLISLSIPLSSPVFQFRR